MRRIALTSATALILALAACGAEPTQTNEGPSEQRGNPGGMTPPIAETPPAVEGAPAQEEPAVATDGAKPPETSRPAKEPVAKAPVPHVAKPAPDPAKPAEPDPHAGHDMDKM